MIGTVYGDSRPLEHATVAVANSQVTTDASGRYRLELVGGPPVGTLVTAYHEQFPFQPCAVSAALAQSGSTELTADVLLTSAKGYSAAAIRITAGARRVFGTVYAIALDGKKEPVADAHVAWESSWDDWKAWSATDSDGRFALCGLAVDRQLSIYAEHSLRIAWANIASGNGDVEIEMILKPIDSETLSASLDHTSQRSTH